MFAVIKARFRLRVLSSFDIFSPPFLSLDDSMEEEEKYGTELWGMHGRRKNRKREWQQRFPFSLQMLLVFLTPSPEPRDCGILQPCLLPTLAVAALVVMAWHCLPSWSVVGWPVSSEFFILSAWPPQCINVACAFWLDLWVNICLWVTFKNLCLISEK